MQAVDLQNAVTGPDGYSYHSDGPRAVVHRLLDAYVEEAATPSRSRAAPKELAAGQAILECDKATQVALLRAALDRLDWLARGGKALLRNEPVTIAREEGGWRSTNHTHRGELIESAYRALFEALTTRSLALTNEDVLHFLEGLVSNLELWESRRPQWEQRVNPFTDEDAEAAETEEPAGFDLYALPTPGLIPLLLKQLEQAREKRGEDPPDALRPWLQRLRAVLEKHQYYAGYKRTVARVDQLLSVSGAGLPDPGKPWADALIDDLRQMEPSVRGKWSGVLEHAPVANQRKPSKKWLGTAEKLLADLGGSLQPAWDTGSHSWATQRLSTSATGTRTC